MDQVGLNSGSSAAFDDFTGIATANMTLHELHTPEKHSVQTSQAERGSEMIQENVGSRTMSASSSPLTFGQDYIGQQRHDFESKNRDWGQNFPPNFHGSASIQEGTTCDAEGQPVVNISVNAGDENKADAAAPSDADTYTQEMMRQKSVYADSAHNSDDAASISPLGSSTSSLTSAGFTTVSDTTIRAVIETLLCTEALSPLYVAATEDQAIGLDRFEQSLRRMLRHYGDAVRSEAVTREDYIAEKLLKSASISGRISRGVMDEIRPVESFDQPHEGKVSEKGAFEAKDLDDEPDGVSSGDDSDDDDFGVEDVEKRLHVTLELLKRSPAYERFKAQLLHYVHAPYERRILRALQYGPRHNDESVQDALHRYGHELSWVPIHLFQFYNETNFGISSLLKGIRMAWTRDNWDRWRLRRRKEKVSPGYVRI